MAQRRVRTGSPGVREIINQPPQIVKEAVTKVGSRALARPETFAAEWAYMDEPYNAYLNEIQLGQDTTDGKSIDFVLAQSDSVNFRKLLQYIKDPRNKQMSLATLARHCDISLAQMVEFVNKSHVARAMARAQMAMPGIVGDMIDDAKSRMVNCSRCDGEGVVGSFNKGNDTGVPDEYKECPNCSGDGKIREVGNQHSRDRLMQTTGMIKSNTGIQINQNFGVPTIENMHGSVLDKIKFGFDDAIDVTPEKQEQS